jgi:hypothetical protein
MSEKAATFHDLAAKGEGVLVKRGDVWTYPAADRDRSGTNVVLPVEYVSDAEVQQAIRDGHVHPATTAPGGAVLSVRVTDGEAGKAISVAQAGTPEAGTELPPNSRPSHDAGMKPASPHDAERIAAAAARGPRAAEGSEVRRPHAEGHETGGRNRNR